MSIELNRKYYINHLKRTNRAINSPFSLLGIHHSHLNAFVWGWVKKLPKGSKILDGGCGLSSWVTDDIRQQYGLYSMDCQIESVKFCRSYYRDNRYLLGDLYALPFADGSMDAIVLREVIEHIKRPERALREVKRVLKQDGILILTTPNYSSFLPFIIENTYHRLFSEIKPYLRDVHPSRFKFSELCQLLKSHLSILEIGMIDLGLNIKAVAKK